MNTIRTADAIDELAQMDAESAHAVVTDPPYGLAFMGKSWDDFEPKEYQEWCEEWAREAKRVLKPGAHLLAFSGNRTYHRLTVGIEDAGFEVRDRIPAHGPSVGLGEYNWVYGSGFPKALDVSKAIDKAADAEREVVGDKYDKPGYSEGADPDSSNTYEGGVSGELNNGPDKAKITAPATDAAKKWDGFKTALKPAHEPILVARKPFDGTVAENVQTHGTGALNIDGTRIGTDDDLEREQGGDITGANYNDAEGESDIVTPDAEGRYPSNVVFDETEAGRLDREVGTLSSGDPIDGKIQDNGREKYGDYEGGEYEHTGFGDSGGPSRYFYTSKASKAERTENGSIENAHPTVKPVDLMEWLVTLVTKENQLVVDPFCGSGTTGKACKHKNRDFIGIEKQPKWADVARVRCGLTPEDPSVVRADESQQGLETYTD